MRCAPGRDRGAVAIVVAIASVLILGAAAFTVDLGMQRVVRSDMQAVADVVSLDMARQLGVTSGAPGAGVSSGWGSALKSSIDRQSDTLGHSPATPPSSAWTCNADLCARATPGWADRNGTFTTTNPGGLTSYNAVKVDATASVAFQLHGGNGSATRSAVANTQDGACFAIGSYAARLNTGSSPILGPLLTSLGSNVSLAAADYNGLASTNVSLVDLLGVSVGAGTLGSLIDGHQLLSIKDYYLAVATALQKESGQTAQVDLLTSIAASLPVDAVELPVGDLLNLGTGGASSGLDAMLNVYDLVTAGALVAEGQDGHAVDVPSVGVNLPPLTSVNASASIISPPTTGCGRKNVASASNSAISVKLATGLADLKLPDGSKLTGVDLSGTVKVAAATGTLTDVRCNPDGITVNVSSKDGVTGLVTVDLKLDINLAGVISGPIAIRGASSTSGDAVVNIANGDYSVPASLQNNALGLPSLAVDTSGLKAVGGLVPVGTILGWLLDPLLKGLVNPVINGLGAALQPVLNSLGIDVSGADVFARPTPKCGDPRLIH